jgi:hypothetical protein
MVVVRRRWIIIITSGAKFFTEASFTAPRDAVSAFVGDGHVCVASALAIVTDFEAIPTSTNTIIISGIRDH